MKKIVLILSVICTLCLTFTACDSDTQAQSQTTKPSSSSAAQNAEDDSAAETSVSSQPSAADNSGSSNSGGSQSDSQSNDDVYTFEYHDSTMPLDDMLSVYETPADAIEIDEKADDPSNKDILFEYDDLGRIVRCSYTVNDVDFFQGYTYSDTEVRIFSYCGSTIVDDVNLSYTYDDSVGFTQHDGYYFNNIKINE